MKVIRKSRREWFGGIVYSEHPGFTAFVGSEVANKLGIPPKDDTPHGIFSAPLDVHLSITDRCNSKCPGCYVGNRSKKPQDMSFPQARMIIDRLASMNVFTIALGGGEPFLHTDMFAIAHYARSKQIVPNVTTNGLLIDEEIASASHVFGKIHISCHDVSELVKLSSVVRCLQSQGISPGINVLISATTYGQLPDIWRWCSQHHISQVLALKFKLTAANGEFRDMVLTSGQEKSLIPLIQSLSRKHGLVPMLDCSLFSALAVHRPRKKDIEFFDINGCQGGNAYLSVTTDGFFKPCSFSDTLLGTVESLDKTSWAECEELQRFRHNSLYSYCKTCPYMDLCNGGCRVCAHQNCLTIENST